MRPNEEEESMYRQEATPQDARDRLDVIDRRIARMKSLNANQGDLLALRLIEHAQTERRQILAEISAAARNSA